VREKLATITIKFLIPKKLGFTLEMKFRIQNYRDHRSQISKINDSSDNDTDNHL
jgi:hypothetical protein